MKKIFKNNKGFGLIELLVVIAIIALLSTIAVVSLNSAKEKARDAVRIADAKQISTALNMYFSDKESYPKTTGIITLGQGNYSCLNGDGFVVSCDTESSVYVKNIPSAPIPPLNNKYTYISIDGVDFQLFFVLEKVNQDLGSGVNCVATKDKVECTE